MPEIILAASALQVAVCVNPVNQLVAAGAALK
jgi:hypothetical protein